MIIRLTAFVERMKLCTIKMMQPKSLESSRDESSVYFNVTMIHHGHLVSRVYNTSVACMITMCFFVMSVSLLEKMKQCTCCLKMMQISLC